MYQVMFQELGLQWQEKKAPASCSFCTADRGNHGVPDCGKGSAEQRGGGGRE